MKEANEPSIVPGKVSGTNIDVKASVILSDETTAREFFRIAMDRLRTVSEWVHLAGNLSAEFQLTDREGNVIHSQVSKGDLIKIDIPGPSNTDGDGYDWVEVEETEFTSSSERDEFSLRVRPTQSPLSPTHETKHFYSGESTSTFTVKREKNVVSAAVYDRNTKPNTEDNTVIGKVRDTLVGAAGITVFSRIQWQNLVDGILSTK